MFMKHNIDNWKEFKIGDLFDVYLSSGDLKITECLSGEIPLVSSGTSNNGIVGYIDSHGDGKAQIFPENSITVDMFCQAFYQNQNFYTVSHGRVNILKPKFKMNELIGIFIATLINKESYKYSYGRAVYSNEISRMIIKLPVLADDCPDWQYIENFMKTLKYKHVTTQNNKNKLTSLETKNWKSYRICDLFDVSTGGDLIISETEDGDYPVASNSSENNNIAFYSCYLPNRKLFNHNISISIADRGSFKAFAQPKDFYIGTRVKALVSKYKEINIHQLLFIVTIINQESYRFSYGYNCCAHLGNMEIHLPTKDNNPDWEYMENYIKSLPYGDRI